MTTRGSNLTPADGWFSAVTMVGTAGREPVYYCSPRGAKAMPLQFLPSGLRAGTNLWRDRPSHINPVTRLFVFCKGSSLSFAEHHRSGQQDGRVSLYLVGTPLRYSAGIAKYEQSQKDQSLPVRPCFPGRRFVGKVRVIVTHMVRWTGAQCYAPVWF